jgi:hypothetical protein
LFKNSAAAALSFIGGTAIRILHDSHRFSEDLKFLARDVEPLLFASKQKERVSTFRDYWLKK